MLLAIDIGNTNIVFGCFDNDRILFRERAATSQRSTALEYASVMLTAFSLHGIDKSDITGAMISSVVPTVTATMKAAVEKLSGVTPMIVGPGIKTGLSILIDNPAQLGSDLVVAAAAGLPFFGPTNTAWQPALLTFRASVAVPHTYRMLGSNSLPSRNSRTSSNVGFSSEVRVMRPNAASSCSAMFNVKLTMVAPSPTV